MAPDEIRSLRDREIAERDAVARDIGAVLAGLAESTTYTQFLRDAATGIKDRRAIFDGETTLSYANLFARVDGAATTLRGHGIVQGDAVAMLVDNSARYVIWFLAILELGAVAVPINNKLVKREIAYIVGNSKARLFLFDKPYDAVVAKVAAEKSGLVLLSAHMPQPAEPTDGKPSVMLDSAAAVYYTSGTTGVPKGVVHTHRTLIAGCLQASRAWGWDFDAPVSMAVTPMFHIASHTLFFPILYRGGTLVIATFSADSVLRLMESEGITSFFGVPSILLIMANRAKELGIAFTRVKVVQFGASPMPMDKLGEVQALFPNARLIHGMGQTESCGTLVTLPGELAVSKIGSVGIPIPATQVAIFDERDNEVPRGQIGELVGRSPSVMREYLGNPDASAETLRGGWLHTGDLGYMDEDGFVYLVDRKKDMIIRGGENVYSNEVEQVLAAHPALSEVAVVGGPDPVMGEKVCAFLVVKPGAVEPDVEEIKQHCRRMLAPYKVPVEIRYLEALPRNATGKVRKPELRQILCET